MRWSPLFPILALPLMMGGVTRRAWFGNSLLVICNTLFLLACPRHVRHKMPISREGHEGHKR